MPVVTKLLPKLLATGVDICEFDDRDQVIDEVRQLQVVDFGFQIRHAVLDRSTPGQHLRDERLLHYVERTAWNLIADLAGHSEGAQPAGAVGQVAETFAEIVSRREHAIRRRNAGIDGPGRAPIDDQTEQHGELVRAVLEQLVLRRGLQVVEPGHGRTAGLRICFQVSLNVTPKSAVMRFEKSAPTSHSVAGGMSAVRDQDMVGSDISSATHGSSVLSVAGRKRAPTKQWAKAWVQGRATNSSTSATAREHL